MAGPIGPNSTLEWTYRQYQLEKIGREFQAAEKVGEAAIRNTLKQGSKRVAERIATNPRAVQAIQATLRTFMEDMGFGESTLANVAVAFRGLVSAEQLAGAAAAVGTVLAYALVIAAAIVVVYLACQLYKKVDDYLYRRARMAQLSAFMDDVARSGHSPLLVQPGRVG